MKSFIFAAALGSLIIVAQPVSAAGWELDKSHSSVGFSVSHLVISDVTGKFTEFDVQLESMTDDFSDMKANAVIKTASINTENQKRDGHLKADDFLNVEKFPEIQFVSRSVTKTAEGRYDITGDLTIRDVTRSVVLDTKFRGVVQDPWGGTRAGFKATTTIDRFEFGTTWKTATELGNLVAGKDVEITLLLEFKKAQ